MSQKSSRVLALALLMLPLTAGPFPAYAQGQPPEYSAGSFFQQMEYLGVDSAQMERRLQEQMERCPSLDPSKDTFERAFCALMVGSQYVALRQNELAEASFRGGAAMLGRLGDPVGAIMVRLAAGQANAMVREFDRAETHFDQALDDLGKLAGSTRPLGLGLMVTQAELLGLGSGLFESMVPMLEGMGRTAFLDMLRSQAHQLYGQTLETQGKTAEAKRHFEQGGGAQGMPVLQMPMLPGFGGAPAEPRPR